MKLRDLFIAAGVLAVLLGVLYWSDHRKQGEDSSVKASPDAPVKFTATVFRKSISPGMVLGPGKLQHPSLSLRTKRMSLASSPRFLL